MEIHALIMAAGSGARFGASLPKQYVDLDGRPVIVHTIERLRSALARSAPEANVTLTVVISPDARGLWDDIAAAHELTDVAVAYGGATRWESVKKALSAVAPGDGSTVLVHDAARPLVSAAAVGRLLAALADEDVDGAIPVTPMVDSLRRLQPDGTSVSVDRSRYVAVQTPQGFPADRLLAAYKRPYDPAFTDDASVMAAAGFTSIVTVDGDPATLKITRPVDLAIVKAILAEL